MTQKSGLADSPFFAPMQPKIEAPTPLPADHPIQKSEPEKIEKPNTPLPQAQIEEIQDQKRTNERTFERPNERNNDHSTVLQVKRK